MSAFCDLCRITLTFDSWEPHINGKRHKKKEASLEQKKTMEDTGLFIKGVPMGVEAADLQSRFQRFGDISRITVHGTKAFLYYVDKDSRDEALKHEHTVMSKVLHVERRSIYTNSPGPSDETGHGQGQKRGFDNTPKNKPLKKVLDHDEILKAIADPAPIISQFSSLKSLLLAGDESCKSAMHNICNDLELALKPIFSKCQLYPFGSMTTGLAFKYSDLDLYADLEIDKSTCMEGNNQKDAKKIFAKAKSCLFRNLKIFSNIVPIPTAKTPIIKFIHNQTNISCDLSFTDAVGYCNSRLLRHYLQMNERFLELVLFTKYWCHVHQFCSSNKFSNFALCMLNLSYFLSLKDSKGNNVVPTVQDLLSTADPSDPQYCVRGWRCAFNTSPITVDLPNTPYFTMPGFLKNFFEYVTQLPFETHVVSVLTGQLLCRRIFKENPNNLPEAYECYKKHITENPKESLVKPDHCVVIHDPFKLNHNLTARVTREVLKSFKKACKVAAEQCTLAMDNDDLQSTLLNKLLERKLSDSEGPKAPQAVVSITSNMPQVFKENPLENSTNLITAILKKIMLFEIEQTLTGDDISQSKICRTKNMRNVSEENTTVIMCQAPKDTWNGRRKACKKVSIQDPPTFDDEVCITSHLKNRSISLLPLECRLVCCEKKLRIQFCNLNEEKRGLFNSCMSFLNTVLRKWIAEFSKTFTPA